MDLTITSEAFPLPWVRLFCSSSGCYHTLPLRWLEHQEIYLLAAQQIVQRVQGCGSGADVAAAIYGGVIGVCRIEPQCIEPQNVHPQITLIYAGL